MLVRFTRKITWVLMNEVGFDVDIPTDIAAAIWRVYSEYINETNAEAQVHAIQRTASQADPPADSR